MSRSLPVSDAALGAFAYTFEFLMGFMGSSSRWRTMPWMVLLFGILVIPLGLVHILLVISQPVVVGEWCTMCLLAALIMLPMLPLEGDEVIAMGQHLLQRKRAGESFWKVFWKGGQATGCTPDERSPALLELPQRPGRVMAASCWGMSVPWNLAASIPLGVLLMASPALFELSKPSATFYHLCGALIVVMSVIAMGEVFRAVRWLNIPLGLAMAIGPFLVGETSPAALVTGLAAGLCCAAMAIRLGPITESYGGWQPYIR